MTSTNCLLQQLLIFTSKYITSYLSYFKGIYRVSHKKRNGGFSVACDLKVPYLFTSSNQATLAEENDTKIIKFDWVILILCPFVKTQSFSNFAWFLPPMSEGLCWEWPFIVVFWGSHWSVSTKETRFNRIPQNIKMKGYSRHNSSLIGRKNRAKFENDRISRNGHRFKTTQPNLMILVSISSAEDVWSNDVN